MFENYRKIWFLFATCLTVTFSIAQQSVKEAPEKYKAIHWTIDKGLSEPNNYAILKDIKGFLWISSGNGLNRFDGNNFKYFFSEKDKNSIADNGVFTGLVEDSLHNIWIGTNKGLSRYDIKADTFTNFTSHGTPGIPFWATKSKILCMDYDLNAIASYDIHTFEKKIVVQLSAIDSIGDRSHKYSYSIFDESGNNLWMLSDMRSDLLQISITDGKRKRYPWPIYNNKKSANHYIDSEGMKYDRHRNCIWINSPEGLLKFSLIDKEYHTINALNKYSHRKDYDRWVGIDLDMQGRIWLATQHIGLIIYNPDDESVELPFPNDSSLQTEVCNFNARLYCDRDGIVWTGSWFTTGVYQLAPFSRTIAHYTNRPNVAHTLSSNDVVNFLQGWDSKVWIGFFGGGILNIFDPTSNQFDVIDEKDLIGVKERIGDSHLIPVCVDTTYKKAWIALIDIYEMDLKTKKCRPVNLEDSAGKVIHRTREDGLLFAFKFGNDCIISAAHDKKQGIFISEMNNAVARQLISFPVEEVQPYISSYNDYVSINLQRLEHGHLTYQYINNKLIRTPIPFDSIPWTEIIYNKADQSYWAVVERQLFHFNKDFQIIQRYTSKEGLPTIGISNLTLDDKGNVWFHTDRSIHQLNTITGVFSELAEKDGFDNIHFLDYPGSMIGVNGDIYFPTGYLAEGFVRISQDKFISPPSSLYIESIEVNQKPLISLVGVNNIEHLSLHYFENKINISTGIIDYYSKGHSHIRYKLEGLSDTWQYGPANYTIRYEGLQPKHYKLILQSSNAANEFNSIEKILLIDISPPFWLTWWFRILSALAGLSVIIGIIQNRAKNLKEKNILLEHKVIARTSELNSSLIELKATQAQLIHSEKMASLGELTSGIAHEIKNPLNFINNFSEINLELLTEIEGNQTATTDSPQVLKFSIDSDEFKNLQKNSEKINHHGKRVESIVNGMLQHSRLGNLVKESVNINTLCDESLKLAYNGFRSKEKTFNATYECRFAADLPNINVIPQDIGRVLINLINNAFYSVVERSKQINGPTHEINKEDQMVAPTLDNESLYTPKIILTTKRMEQPLKESKISITISDNGIGISPAIITKIFQPFFTTKPTGEGTGLGLSMSYDIITKGHAGELNVTSEEGKCTDFEIILPIQL